MLTAFLNIPISQPPPPTATALRPLPFPVPLGRIGMMGDGTGSGGSSLTRDRSGYLLTSMPTTLSGEDEGTTLSGVSRSPPWSCVLGVE